MKMLKNISAEKLTEGLKKLGYELVNKENGHITFSITLTFKKDGEEESETLVNLLTIPDHNPIKPVTLSAIAGDVAMCYRKKKALIVELLLG